MSQHFANASLAGCPPSTRYQVELKTLQDAMEKVHFGGTGMDHMFASTPTCEGFWMSGYDNKDYAPPLVTDDGYGWYIARMYLVPNGGFIILVPWSSNKSKKDGTTADRALQIHQFGVDAPKLVRQVLADLTQECVLMYENQPADAIRCIS